MSFLIFDQSTEKTSRVCSCQARIGRFCVQSGIEIPKLVGQDLRSAQRPIVLSSHLQRQSPVGSHGPRTKRDRTARLVSRTFSRSISPHQGQVLNRLTAYQDSQQALPLAPGRPRQGAGGRSRRDQSSPTKRGRDALGGRGTMLRRNGRIPGCAGLLAVRADHSWRK
jgi:hypothetical protein